MIVLSTHGLTVRAYSRVLLFDVDMAIPASGVTCLMGPCAAGKSTLLRAVSWQLQGRGGFRVDGVVRYGDHQVSDGYAPAVVAQQLQQPLLTVFELIVDNLPERAVLRRAEQRELIGERLVALGCAGLAEAMDTQLIDLSLLDARRAAIVRELVADPQLICIDEPCTGLEDDAALRMMALLEQTATERPVLWVTHHQARARALANHVVLLAAGQVVEQLPVEEFFTNPRHRCAQQFVRSGGCDLPSPNASPDEVDESWRSA